MRVLAKIKNSILWLSKSNNWVKENLRNQAIKYNIDPNKLVFAERVPSMSEHLARHQHADLFVDTFNYNAHSTAIDALWSGLPVITKLGKQFSSRVAGSLLYSIGLEELITKDERSYEDLIIELSVNKNRLEKVKKKLRENIKEYPLFKMNDYTKNFEKGLENIYEVYKLNSKRKDIYI